MHAQCLCFCAGSQGRSQGLSVRERPSVRVLVRLPATDGAEGATRRCACVQWTACTCRASCRPAVFQVCACDASGVCALLNVLPLFGGALEVALWV